MGQRLQSLIRSTLLSRTGSCLARAISGKVPLIFVYSSNSWPPVVLEIWRLFLILGSESSSLLAQDPKNSSRLPCQQITQGIWVPTARKERGPGSFLSVRHQSLLPCLRDWTLMGHRGLDGTPPGPVWCSSQAFLRPMFPQGYSRNQQHGSTKSLQSKISLAQLSRFTYVSMAREDLYLTPELMLVFS